MGYSTYGVSFFRGAVSSELKRGDIIAFDRPGDESVQFVKRVVALPGDKFSYRNKQLTINGRSVPHRKEDAYLMAGWGKNAVKLARYTETLDAGDYSVAINEDAPWIRTAPDSFPFKDKCAYDDQGLTCEVPAGNYFVMGDNRDDSRDSRYWGFVPADHIVGKVAYVLQ